jgi:hypothetical protein
MKDVTRRWLLSRGSLGAAGVVGVLGAGPTALSMLAESEPELADHEIAAVDSPIFVHVLDAAAGKVELLTGESSVVINDKALVAKLLRATP